MYVVTIRGPDGTEANYPLGPDEGLIVGRDDTCDVVLPSKRVSRRHARFFTDGELLHVEDLGSHNGIFVGGSRIQGTSEIRPGPPIEIGEFVLRIKKQEPRQLAAVSVDVNQSAIGYLQGLAAMQGRTLPLEKERYTVGREAGVDLVVEDDSVSRKHGELRAEAGAVWVLKDFGSSNGTFVNGTRLKPNGEQRLKDGDKVRFGETHWMFHAGRAQAGGGGSSGGLNARSKLLLGVAAGLVVLFVVIGIARKSGPTEEEIANSGDVVAPEDLAYEANIRGDQAMAEDRFDDARLAYREALDADPVNVEARAKLRKAEAELENARYNKESANKTDLGKPDDALALLLKISTDSRFFAAARTRAQELATLVKKRDLPACRDALRKGNAKAASETCGRYLDLTCHVSLDDALAKQLRALDARTPGKVPWECPARLAAWFGAGVVGGPDPTKELAARYRDADIREAMLAYVKGDLPTAKRKLQAARGGSDKSVADELFENVSMVEGRFSLGTAAIRRDDLKGARTAFDEALASDAKILPPSIESVLARQMKGQLAEGLAKQGDDALARNDHDGAFTAYSAGFGYSRTQTSVNDGLAKLEKVAEEILSSGPDCEGLRKALRITLASPVSTMHGRADEAFQAQCR